jgi:hypothetical protein
MFRGPEDLQRQGWEDVPFLRPIAQRALDVIEDLPFSALKALMISMSRYGVGFDTGAAFEACANEILKRSDALGTLNDVHWLSIFRLIQEVAMLTKGEADFKEPEELRQAKRRFVARVRALWEDQITKDDSSVEAISLILMVQAFRMWQFPNYPDLEWQRFQHMAIVRVVQQGNIPLTMRRLSKLGVEVKPHLTLNMVHWLLGAACTERRWEKYGVAEIRQLLVSMVELKVCSPHYLRLSCATFRPSTAPLLPLL